MTKFARVLLMTGLAIITAPKIARADSMPDCLANGSPMGVNDAQVEKWEDSTKNNYSARAHIQGPINAIYPDATGHKHFSVQIGATPEDAVEVIYNESFGSLPALQVGMTVEACGDYITDLSSGHNGSPDHAILHWVHKSDTTSHPSGYVAIDSTIYGQENGHGN